MPAEWAPHHATWFSWPHNPDTWPDQLAGAEHALASAVAALSAGEKVYINVLDDAHADHVRRMLPAETRLEAVSFEAIQTNDAWCRDHGAIFVTNGGGQLTALNFRFNAWGDKYPPYDLDDAVPPQMAQRVGVPVVAVDHVLEGGSIDVNGAGALLTTRQCLLHPNRNPGRSQGEIEALLHEYLGAEQVFWLGDGIVGDDTDGHVDDITRFVAEDTVITAVEADPTDPNHAPLAANRQALDSFRLADGRALKVVELPMPDAVVTRGERLPASYANFYIANGLVLVPVFGCDRDADALAIIEGCFPGRRVVGIDCRDVVVGLGTLHCLSQQVPA
ncbi:MAG: agmatine deiminase family protein [Gammaproteobacteria bacterium]|nr:agmatine deiminase family protein [Gammaproteobacteria bacterium]